MILRLRPVFLKAPLLAALLGAGLQMRPGARAISTDTCVPISRLAASVEGARKLLEASGFPSLPMGAFQL